MRLVGIEVAAGELRVAWGERRLGAVAPDGRRPRAARRRWRLAADRPRRARRRAPRRGPDDAAPGAHHAPAARPALPRPRAPRGHGAPRAARPAAARRRRHRRGDAHPRALRRRLGGARRRGRRAPRWRHTRRPSPRRACPRRASTSRRCRRSRWCPTATWRSSSRTARRARWWCAAPAASRGCARSARIRTTPPRSAPKHAGACTRSAAPRASSWRVRTRRASSLRSRRRSTGRSTLLAPTAALAGDADPAEDVALRGRRRPGAGRGPR